MLDQIKTQAKRFKTQAKRLTAPAIAGAAMIGSNAHAAVNIDVTDVVDTITGGVTTVTTLGISVLSLVVVIKLFRWVRGAM